MANEKVLVKEPVYNIRTGEITGYVEVEAYSEFDPEAEAKIVHESNLPLLEEMRLADIQIVRALLEGDTERIEAHKKAQAERRARLKK